MLSTNPPTSTEYAGFLLSLVSSNHDWLLPSSHAPCPVKDSAFCRPSTPVILFEHWHRLSCWKFILSSNIAGRTRPKDVSSEQKGELAMAAKARLEILFISTTPLVSKLHRTCAVSLPLHCDHVQRLPGSLNSVMAAMFAVYE
jgi:hypothetical protein